MRINLWLSLFLLTVTLAACGGKTPVKEAEKPQTAEEMKYEAQVRDFVEAFVVFADKQYELCITEQEASTQGIDKETYDKVCKMVEDTNKMLRDQIDTYRNDSTTQMMLLNGDTIIFDKKPNKE